MVFKSYDSLTKFINSPNCFIIECGVVKKAMKT